MENIYSNEEISQTNLAICKCDSEYITEDEENIFIGTTTQTSEDNSDVEREVNLETKLISSFEELRKSKRENKSLEEKISKYKEKNKSNEEEFKTLREELYITREQMMAIMEEAKSLKKEVASFKIEIKMLEDHMEEGERLR